MSGIIPGETRQIIRAVPLRRQRARAQPGSIDTIRDYERMGLVTDVARTAGGHPFYNEHHVRRLGFIRRRRDLGLD